MSVDVLDVLFMYLIDYLDYILQQSVVQNQQLAAVEEAQVY